MFTFTYVVVLSLMQFSGRGEIWVWLKAVETKTEEKEFGKILSEKVSKLFWVQQQKSLSQVLTESITKGTCFLLPFLTLMRTMSCVLGNVLCTASYCMLLKDRYSRKKTRNRKLYRKYTMGERDLT